MALPSTVLYEKREHVAIITINRPDALNSLTVEMLTGIEDAFGEFDADSDGWVAILTAAGDKAFSSGLDLKEAAPLLTGGDALGFEDTTKRQFSDVIPLRVGSLKSQMLKEPCLDLRLCGFGYVRKGEGDRIETRVPKPSECIVLHGSGDLLDLVCAHVSE